MPHTKILQLIKGLRDQTRENKIHWQATNRENIYQASFPGTKYTLLIMKLEEDVPSPQGYIVSINDKDGIPIERIKSEELIKIMNEGYTALNEVYIRARRKALGVDQALEELLSILSIPQENGT